MKFGDKVKITGYSPAARVLDVVPILDEKGEKIGETISVVVLQSGLPFLTLNARNATLLESAPAGPAGPPAPTA